MTIEQWLQRATRYLSCDSGETVRREILEHFEESRATALAEGVTPAEAEAIAVAALGNAREANRLYRRTLLTRREARLLSQGNWEARAVCSSGVLKNLMALAPVFALGAAGVLYLRGDRSMAETLAVASGFLAVLLVGPFLPIYTSSRAQIYRVVKWAAFLGLYAWLAVELGWRQSWLLYCAMWPVVWIELARASIRRKLPAAQWPKQLYL